MSIYVCRQPPTILNIDHNVNLKKERKVYLIKTLLFSRSIVYNSTILQNRRMENESGSAQTVPKTIVIGLYYRYIYNVKGFFFRFNKFISTLYCTNGMT